MIPATQHPPWRSLVRQILGWACIFVGIVGLIIPIMPHTPFLAAGALLLAPHVRIFRRLSAWLHRRFPRWRGPLRRFRDFKRPWRAAEGKSPCKAPEADAVCAVNDREKTSGGTRT